MERVYNFSAGHCSAPGGGIKRSCRRDDEL